MGARISGDSVQEVGTPRALLDAVERRFGRITFDLAADASNHVVDRWYGPGGEAEDALASAWYHIDGLLWLNPPFNMLGMFVRKARDEWSRGARIAMLMPASVATNWFAEHVWGAALVLPIRPRLTFVGHADPYPKDLMLVCYNLGPVGFEPWKWM